MKLNEIRRLHLINAAEIPWTDMSNCKCASFLMDIPHGCSREKCPRLARYEAKNAQLGLTDNSLERIAV